MYRNACVVSAGRAVLEMMQHDWEPLSHGELDQRLDQAVEEILEAELMAKVQAQAQTQSLLLQVSQSEEPVLHLQTHSQDLAHPQVVFQLADMVAVSPSTDNDLQRQSAEKAEENPAVQVGCKINALSTCWPTNSLLTLVFFIPQHIMDLLKNANTSYNRSRLAGRARLSLSHTVLLSLTLLSKRRSYRSVSTSFRLEKGNIHRIFFSFCERVNALEEQQIRWPTSVYLEII